MDNSRIRNCESSSSQCEYHLYEIITERLRQNSPLTWHGIVRALRADSVSENRLASEIENKYIHQLPPPAVAPHTNTSSLISSLHSSFAAGQYNNSPQASFSVNQYPSDPVEINAPQPSFSVPQLERAACSTHTSAHHLTRVLPLSEHYVGTPRTDTALTHTSHATHPPLTNLLPLHPSMQPHMPIPHTMNYSFMRPPQYLPHCLSQHFPVPTSYPSTAQPQGFEPYACDRQWYVPPYYPHSSSPSVLLHKHASALTTAIGNDLPYFSVKFIELEFVTRTAANDISTKLGIGNREKGGQLLNLVTENCNMSLDKEKWLDKFVATFSSEAAYKNLATRMIEDFSTGKYRTCGPSPVSHDMSPQPITRAQSSQEGVTGSQWDPQLYWQPSSQSQSNSPNDRKVMLQMFVDDVKTLYMESEVERDTEVVKWPPTPSKAYINLAYINRKSVSGKSLEYAEITEATVRDGNVDVIHAQKGRMEFHEIAKGISIPTGTQTISLQATHQRMILVEGAPGVGKSTFAKEFCMRWARGEIAQQYQLVLLLRLRVDRINEAKSLKDLIYHPLESVSKAVSEELILSRGLHTLILLEGFDELSDQSRNHQSIFFKLITGKLLPLATVLVTSRPWATEKIHWIYGNRIYQHIEILGFTSQQITEYIERTLPQDKVSELKDYLERHPQIRQGMYIPLNSAIVVSVYQESQEAGCALPTTLTELYTVMARTLLLRYLHSHPQYETVTIQTFNDLPREVYTEFSELCKLAYRGTVGTSDRIQLIFTDLPSDFGLGLMDSVTELYASKGAVSSHNFLHLTFQEYFAAVHISTLSPTERLQHFKRHKEGRLKVVLRFLAGLNELSCVSNENVKHFLSLPPAERRSPKSIPVNVAVTTDLVNWMFEAQSSDVIALALENKKNCIAQSLSPLDYYCLGYCLAHCQCQWASLGGIWHTGEEGVKMLVAGAIATKQPSGNVVRQTGGEQWPSGKVVGLREGKHEISVEVLNMLFSEWQNIDVLHIHDLALRLPVPCDSVTWPDLSALRVLSLGISGKTNWRLDTLLSHLSLESLSIHECHSNVCLMFEDCMAIAKYITLTSCLKELCLVHDMNVIIVRDKGLEAILKALADNQALPLERLELELKCKFADTAADCLTRFISNTTTLQYIKIRWCIFSAHRLLELARVIHDSSTLQEKSLEVLICSVNSDNEAKDWSQLLVEYPQVEGGYKYSVLITHINETETLATAQALKNNFSLGQLYLSNNGISDAGAVAISRDLHHNLSQKELVLSKLFTSQMFIDYVGYGKTIHKKSEVEGDTKIINWPPTPSKVYINLACVNRKTVSLKSTEYAAITETLLCENNVDVISTTKGPIEFCDIAKDISIPSGKQADYQATEMKRVILVEGAPGVGKSTFAREFCRRWERREIAQQYQLVLLLRLRDDRISNAKNLRDLINHLLEGVPQAVSGDFMLSYGFHTLIILEGFDELPDHCRNDQSIFLKLIAGKLLPLATVLVTSRPWATKRIRSNYRNRIYQHIQILGFSSHEVTEYIEAPSLPQDRVTELKAHLEMHSQIKMSMYIPLNTAIIVTVYQESQESGCAPPTTLTELYTAMAQNMLTRYLRGHLNYETTTIHTFNDLPPAVYTKFSELCKLAYTGMIGTSERVQLIFTDLPSDFDSLGLMDSVIEFYVTREAILSHKFLHMTFQEYFAAVHISTLSPAEQLEHFMRNKEGRLKEILRFLAGLTEVSCFAKENVHHFLTPPWDRGSSTYSMPVDVGVTTDLVNWMFEAQKNDVTTFVLGKKTVSFSIAQYNMTPLDYYSLAYCIAHSQCQWALSVSGGEEPCIQGIGEDEVRMLGAGINTTQQPTGRVVELRVGECTISVEALNMLFTKWKSVLRLHELSLRLPVACDSITWPDLSALQVLSLDINDKASWRMNTLLPHLSLISLTFTINKCRQDVSLVFEDCVAIGNHITATTCLKQLCFLHVYNAHHNIVDDKGLEIITKSLVHNQSLPLERLELKFKCTFTDTAADCLAQFISNTITLQHLRLSDCTFSAHKLLELANTVRDNTILREKNLEDLSCTVNHSDDVKDLARLEVEYPEVGKYEITHISDEGVVALAQALHHNSTLTSLYFSNNSISGAGAIAIAQALHHNSTLEKLYLSNNAITDDGAVALAQALCHNSTLEKLYLSKNVISDAGAVAIAQALYQNSSLNMLDLDCNEGIVLYQQPIRIVIHSNRTTHMYMYITRVPSEFRVH